MSPVGRVPPGRAGRLWLTHRLDVATRGADQLERKVQILSLEVARQRRVADERRRDWEKACRDAETWALRAGLVSGQDAVRHAAPAQQAVVAVSWTTTIGVRHAADASLSAPGLADVVANAATICAADAHVAALRAALSSAVADAAVTAFDDALLATRRRARVLRYHWIPQLRALLASLELSLEQAEQEDYARLRRLSL